MANESISTNMNMPIPGVGLTTGPQYATDNNNCLLIIDQHDHTSGNGVPITPSGMLINSNLSFQQNSATNLLAATFSSQSIALSGTNFLSTVGGNLYFNDGSGNQIPITAGGGVAGSPGSIGSLAPPASATYSAGSTEFIWQSGSSKAAAMDNGAVTIRETNVTSAKGITIASPTALAADFSLTLFGSLPASTKYLSCDVSGNVGLASADAIGQAMTSVGADAIAASLNSTGADAIAAKMSVTGVDAIASTMDATGANTILNSTDGSNNISAASANKIRTNTTKTVSSTVGLGGFGASSGSSGSFTTSSSTPVTVTSCTFTITTSGKPVDVYLTGDGSTNISKIGMDTSGAGGDIVFRITRNGTVVYATSISSQIVSFGSPSGSFYIPPSSIFYTDRVAAGTYTYLLQTYVNVAPATIYVYNCSFYGSELV